MVFSPPFKVQSLEVTGKWKCLCVQVICVSGETERKALLMVSFLFNPISPRI